MAPARIGLAVAVSRAINRRLLLGGRECVCARAHRERWVVAEAALNLLFIWRERDHCRAIHAWESALPEITDVGAFAAARIDGRVRLSHTVTLSDGSTADVGRDLTPAEAMALASRLLLEALGR